MDQEGLYAVRLLDVGLGDAGLEAEYGVGVKPEDGEDALDFGVLKAVLGGVLCGKYAHGHEGLRSRTLSKSLPAASSSARTSSSAIVSLVYSTGRL